MKWLVIALLLVGGAYAANSLSEMNVVVFPDVASTTFSYNFVFSSSSTCSPVLLNVSQSITTNSAGRGNATLDLSTMSATPAYLCTYRTGILVDTQSLNPNAFEAGNVTSIGNGTEGMIPYFVNNSIVNNTNLFFDVANNRFGLGTFNPLALFHVFGDALFTTVNATTFYQNGFLVLTNESNSINEDNLNITNTGTAGQVLMLNSSGGLNWTTALLNQTNVVESRSIYDNAITPEKLNTTDVGIAGQVLTYNSSGGLNWTNKTHITIITAVGATNWNKPVGANYVTVFICGGGGSGGGGSAAAQGVVRSGGGGGGGGKCVTKTFNIADLTDPVSVTIGAGGAAVVGAADGNFGATSTFGGYINALGGGGGAANAAGSGGGGGGGCAVRGTSATTNTGATGGSCFVTIAANTASGTGAGAGGATAGAGVVNGPSSYVSGAGGGAASTGGAAAGGAGGSSQFAAAGGGGGGGVNAATPGTVQNGGAGGSTGAAVIAAGGGGTAGTGAGACGGVGDGQTGTSGYFGVGGHGGGGGGSKAAAATAGCTGGTGGAFGGGGGGGGGGTTAGAGGAGGAGGDGGAIIIAW